MSHSRARHAAILLPALALAVLACGGSSALGIDWPQWLGPNRDGVWRETGLIQKFPPGGPKVLWRTPTGTGYCGPAVADGLVYVMDRQRAKDAAGKPLASTLEGIPGTERILCLKAVDGKLVWQHEYPSSYNISYPSGPRATPLVQDGLVYTLGAMGDLLCLDARTGTVRWSKNLPKEYNTKPPVWGYAAHPLIDGNLLYTLVGGDGSAVVAFNKDTGNEVWKALKTEEVAYSPPVIYEAGGKRQLIIWHSDSINGLDPITGQVYWTQRYPSKGTVQRPCPNIITARRMDDLLFISSYYHGPMMLKLAADHPGVNMVWESPPKTPNKLEGLCILMSTPILRDGLIYGVAFDGQLLCLDAKTGKKLWGSYAINNGKPSDCGTSFLIPQGDRFIIYNDQGDLILANLSGQGYQEIDRAHILDAVESARRRTVVWSHPAFAQKCLFARNDKEMICVSLAAEDSDAKRP